MKITDHKPNARMMVASGSVLPVVAVGDLTLSNLSGFILESVPRGSLAQYAHCGWARPQHCIGERETHERARWDPHIIQQ